MTTDIKNQITAAINEKIDSLGLSANKIATQCGVSGATISQMRNGNWKLIKDEMWRKVAAGIGYNLNQWMAASTRNYNTLTKLFNLARTDSMSIGVAHNPGSGKTFACQQFAAHTPNAYHINCAEHFTKKMFLEKTAQAMGVPYNGERTRDILERIIGRAATVDRPVFLFDEADKLNDRVLCFFIELYNRLDGKAGFVLLGAPYLRKRIESGASRDKMGFREIYSRIGKRFVDLDRTTQRDITSICESNGIIDPVEVAEVINEAETADYDLRRVRRVIQVIRKRKEEVLS